MSKTYDSIESTRSLIFDEQLYQKSIKTHTITSAGSLTIDLNSGNYQSIDLTNAASDITVTFSNPQIALYALSIKQHDTTRRSISFNGVDVHGFDLLDLPLGSESLVQLLYNGTNYELFNKDKKVALYSADKSYITNDLSIYDDDSGMSLFVATQASTKIAFVSSRWTRISAVNATQIAYDDPTGSGNTTVHSALVSLFSSARFISATYADIDTLLTGNSNHQTNAAFLVNDVAAGTVSDIRAFSGFAIYVKTSTTTGSILDYRVLSAELLEANYIHFSNTQAGLNNNPATVQVAIEELKALVDSIASGAVFRDNWDAANNEPVIGNNAKYSDGSAISPVLAVDVTNQTLTVSAPPFATINVGDTIRVSDSTVYTTLTVTNKSTVSSNNVFTVTKSDGTPFVVGDVEVGFTALGANIASTSGVFYFVESVGTNVTVDTISSWAVSDRVVSNGSSWLRQTSNQIVLATDVRYDPTSQTWPEVDPTNVNDAINILNSRTSSMVTVLAELFILKLSGNSSNVSSFTDYTAGDLAGLTSYILDHSFGDTDIYDLIIDVYCKPTAADVFTLVLPDTIRTHNTPPNSEIELIIDTLTGVGEYYVNVRSQSSRSSVPTP